MCFIARQLCTIWFSKDTASLSKRWKFKNNREDGPQNYELDRQGSRCQSRCELQDRWAQSWHIHWKDCPYFACRMRTLHSTYCWKILRVLQWMIAKLLRNSCSLFDFIRIISKCHSMYVRVREILMTLSCKQRISYITEWDRAPMISSEFLIWVEKFRESLHSALWRKDLKVRISFN